MTEDLYEIPEETVTEDGDTEPGYTWRSENGPNLRTHVRLSDGAYLRKPAPADQ